MGFESNFTFNGELVDLTKITGLELNKKYEDIDCDLHCSIFNTSAWDNGNFASNHCTYNEDDEAYKIDDVDSLRWLLDLAIAENFIEEHGLVAFEMDYDATISFVKMLLDQELEVMNKDENEKANMFTINYHIGVGNQMFETLEKCFENVNPVYTEQDITIQDTNNILYISKWNGFSSRSEFLEARKNEDCEILANFGYFGYYSAWVEL